jgi:hypothetical protein
MFHMQVTPDLAKSHTWMTSARNSGGKYRFLVWIVSISTLWTFHLSILSHFTNIITNPYQPLCSLNQGKPWITL